MTFKEKVCNANQKVNGKKRYIIGGPIGGGLTIWLVNIIMGLNTAVAVNAKEIERVEELPQKVSAIEQKVESIDKQFTEFRGDYKDDQTVFLQVTLTFY